jgi:hypothetical protein
MSGMMVRRAWGVEGAGKIATAALPGVISAMGLLLEQDRPRRIYFHAAGHGIR